MPDRTNSPTNPRSKGPWPEWVSVEQIYDHGADWCANADGHPAPEGGYPDVDQHVPAFECRTLGTDVDAPPRPGRTCCALRSTPPGHFDSAVSHRRRRSGTRIVFEIVEEGTDVSVRFSVTPR